MARDYNFWGYIVTNRNDSVLYIGNTNNLSRRTWEHREGNRHGFAADYRCAKLIYCEWYGTYGTLLRGRAN
jgi:putative endonuclease